MIAAHLRLYSESMRASRWVATALAGLAAVLLAVVGTLLAIYRPGVDVAGTFAGLVTIGAVTTGLGVAVAYRRPDNPVGALLTWVGAIVVFLAARTAYAEIWVHRPDAVPLDARVVALFEESGWWLWTAAALLLLYFPDGKVPGRRWRWVPPALVAATAVQQAYGAFGDLPFLAPLQDLPRPWGPAPTAFAVVGEIGFFGMLALAAACVASLVVRFRRSTGARRAQLKWLSLAGFVIVVYPFVCLAEIAVTGHSGPVATVLGVVALVSLPVAVSVAMLRHELYDVDRVLAATITYAIATVVLVGVFTATTVVGGLLVGRGSAVTAAVATAICAVALAPLRRRVQQLVDKRFYPPRRAALTAIEKLQDRIHAGAAQPEELEGTLRAALKEPSLRVGLRLPGTGRVVDASGAPLPGGREVPVVLGTQQVGVLSCEPESGAAVLRAIAPATAVLIEVMRLRAELAAALRDVQESRARLVHAGNLERHRLERDLHDGAQQRLVSLGMAMRIAQMQLGGGAVDVNGVLERAVAELGTAIAELRQIAHGLRPASLDDGLHAALSGLTRTLPMPVHLDIATDGLPDDLATTAYYVACEALTNAAKHAGAERVAVRVSHASDVLRIRVEDDGQGGAVLREGSGLAGLVDRVSALGGSMTMSSPRGSGTVIEAELPCAS